MDGDVQRDHRPLYGLRQALVAIALSMASIGAIAGVPALLDNGNDGDRAATVVPDTMALETLALETLALETMALEPSGSLASIPGTSVAAAPAGVQDTSGTSTPLSDTQNSSAPTSASVTVALAGLPAVDASAFAVYDVTSQTWMAESQADVAMPVGSVMKLLTSYVVLQAGDLAKVVTVPDLDVDISESAIGIYAGEQLPRDVLLRAMLIVSANDAARALAIDVGGSVQGFVDQMNAAAAQLGLSATVAANPIGLDAAGAQSSARDMIELAALLMQDQTFREAVAKTSANLHGQTFQATNKLLTSYQGATGVKTGHTTDAGYCLVGSATRNGRTLIVAVFGLATDAERLAATTALLDWGFAQP